MNKQNASPLLEIEVDMQGISLKPIPAGEKTKVRDSFYYHFYRHNDALPEMVGVRKEDYKLIHYPGLDDAVQWEPFDLSRDADEMKNVYANPEYQNVRRRLEQALLSLAEACEDPIDLMDR